MTSQVLQRQKAHDVYCTSHTIQGWFTLAILSAIFLLLANVMNEWHAKDLELFTSENQLYTFVCEFTHLHPSET
jgi:hypothetical protein